MQKFEKDILDILKSFKTRSHMENCDVLDAIEEYVTVEKSLLRRVLTWRTVTSWMLSRNT
ncbi:hypothetical protein Ab1vBOLIVR6_gp141 [Agrobacterium phage OLIVR6]|nr:hypothetical protein Ab1vBOLIVR6_gp141 [Agrobacterium phage OLIVR6]